MCMQHKCLPQDASPDEVRHTKDGTGLPALCFTVPMGCLSAAYPVLVVLFTGRMHDACSTGPLYCTLRSEG